MKRSKLDDAIDKMAEFLVDLIQYNKVIEDEDVVMRLRQLRRTQIRKNILIDQYMLNRIK